MAFVCAAESEARQRLEKLGEIRDFMKLIEEKMAVPCSVTCPPNPCPPPPPPSIESMACVPCPLQVPEPPKIMVCYKVSAKSDKKASKLQKNKRLKKSKSRELRASILHVGCDCEKRNGLQDDCQRSECYGSPDCLTKPDPICGPSEYAGGKHLGRNRYLNKTGNNANNNNGDDDVNNEDGTVDAKYRCYPATITEIKL